MFNDASHSTPLSHPIATSGSSPVSSFTAAASRQPSVTDVKSALSRAAKNFHAAQDDLSLDDLNDIQHKLDAMKRAVQEQKMYALLDRMATRIAGLTDPEAPAFGRGFIGAMKAADCHFVLSGNINSHAVYTSYSYADHNRGFANEVKFNPEHVEDEDRFTSSTGHELFHAYQTHASPALKCSPFNPESRVVVHPADWILLEAACERDAYTKQALLNSLLAKSNPHIRAQTSRDIVSVKDFEATRAKYPSLADAVVAAALKSLSKPVSRSTPDGRTFVNNYQDVALGNYANGMAMRKKEGEKDLVFVRLELEDLWQVGNYGVGPNSFGEHVMEPLIQTRHKLLPDAQEKLDRICAEHGIPPLERCPTLRAYRESLDHDGIGASRPYAQTAQAPKPAPLPF